MRERVTSTKSPEFVQNFTIPHLEMSETPCHGIQFGLSAMLVFNDCCSSNNNNNNNSNNSNSSNNNSNKMKLLHATKKPIPSFSGNTKCFSETQRNKKCF